MFLQQIRTKRGYFPLSLSLSLSLSTLLNNEHTLIIASYPFSNVTIYDLFCNRETKLFLGRRNKKEIRFLLFLCSLPWLSRSLSLSLAAKFTKERNVVALFLPIFFQKFIKQNRRDIKPRREKQTQFVVLFILWFQGLSVSIPKLWIPSSVPSFL